RCLKWSAEPRPRRTSHFDAPFHQVGVVPAVPAEGTTQHLRRWREFRPPLPIPRREGDGDRVRRSLCRCQGPRCWSGGHVAGERAATLLGPPAHAGPATWVVPAVGTTTLRR